MTSRHHFIAALIDAGMGQHDAEKIGTHIWGKYGDAEGGGPSLCLLIEKALADEARICQRAATNIAALREVRERYALTRYAHEQEQTP